MGKDKKPLNESDHLVMACIGVFFGGMILSKLWVWFYLWIIEPRHMAAVCLAVFLLILLGAVKVVGKIKRSKANKRFEKSITEKTTESVYSGTDKKNGGEVWIKPGQRTMHTQVIGTTNAGKTESIILPWAIQDIRQGRGLILIDGKADRSLLDKIWAYTVKAGRQDDFRLISLSSIDESHQFNPLVGGSSEEISERVFNAFEFENPHYRALQFEVFSQVLRIFNEAGETATFLKLHQAISDPTYLVGMADRGKDRNLSDWASVFRSLEKKDRENRTSGLLSALSQFAFGASSQIFNAENSSVTIDEALKKGQILYFQLPVLRSPFLGKASGKLILQSLQSAIASRHSSDEKREFFSVYLDDFSEYLYPGFVSILNKSRSANVGIVFAHQALGDITALGDSVANSILVNSNIKFFMRGNDPDSAEYFSKVLGTVAGRKSTERVSRKGWFGSKESTGETSERDVEEFLIHPNHFKRELGVGEGVMILPHSKGAKMVNMRFDMFPDLEAVLIPKPVKEIAVRLKIEEKIDSQSATKKVDVDDLSS